MGAIHQSPSSLISLSNKAWPTLVVALPNKITTIMSTMINYFQMALKKISYHSICCRKPTFCNVCFFQYRAAQTLFYDETPANQHYCCGKNMESCVANVLAARGMRTLLLFKR